MRQCTHKNCRREASHFIEVAAFKFPVCVEHVKLPEHFQKFAPNTDASPITESEHAFDEEVSPVVVRLHAVFGDEKCKHYQMLVDDELRTVECGKCGQLLDPVQCLIELAHGLRKTDYKLEAVADYERKQIEQKDRYREREFKRKLKDSNIKPVA